jgi:hypothetical protein
MLSAIATLIGTAPVLAESIQLKEYLSSMNRKEVKFSGRIGYNGREHDFTFYDETRDPFGVTVDAGRDARERIEKECVTDGFMISYSKLCLISGNGTVEIRGSRVYLSIETVESLSK